MSRSPAIHSRGDLPNQTLALASVLGREFILEVLARVGEVSVDELLEKLDDDVRARVIVETDCKTNIVPCELTVISPPRTDRPFRSLCRWSVLSASTTSCSGGIPGVLVFP